MISWGTGISGQPVTASGAQASHQCRTELTCDEPGIRMTNPRGSLLINREGKRGVMGASEDNTTADETGQST